MTAVKRTGKEMCESEETSIYLNHKKRQEIQKQYNYYMNMTIDRILMEPRRGKNFASKKSGQKNS